jgi:hypothetical protein
MTGKSEIPATQQSLYQHMVSFRKFTDSSDSIAGPYCPLGTVPRAYEGMEGRKNKNKEMKSRKM